MPSSAQRRRDQQILRISEDPARFSESILGQDIWSKQVEILHSVARHSRTAVKACHASGKTYIAAAAALWWITSQLEAIAVTTAPTWTQVERVLWGEIHRACAGARIRYPTPTATSLQLGPGRYLMGLSTNEGVRFQGFHGNVLVVLDEAPGVLTEIWEAIEGIRAGGQVRVLALGNPTISSGPFYEAFGSQRESWNPITISAFDTPNLEGVSLEELQRMPESELDQNPRPYLTTRRWVKEKSLEWGLGHPLWESRVEGKFPTQSADALVSLSWLEAAKASDRPGNGDWNAGVDVAGPGEDETVLVIRDGPRIVQMLAWPQPDPRGEIVRALTPYKGQLKTVQVDTAGIGHYLAKHLEDHKFPVRYVNVGEHAQASDKYVNRKAELYWGLRMRFESGDVSGLRDEKSIAQLCGIRYHHNARGQVVIESKEEARKRGVKSPDRAEAIMLAFAVPRAEPRIRFLGESNSLWREVGAYPLDYNRR